MKLDPTLQDVAQQAVAIHEKLHNSGFHGMTGKEFQELYYTNLNNYIAFIAHAQFEAGLQDAVIILKDVIPLRADSIKDLLDHHGKGLRFTRQYAPDIAACKRKVAIWVHYTDNSEHYAIYGVKDIEAKPA